MMNELSRKIIDQLLENGRERARCMAAGRSVPDFYPVVKLFTPDAACTWLVTDVDAYDPDVVYGLCDVGDGAPKLGSVRFSELDAIRGPLDLPVLCDTYFSATKPISAYAQEARVNGVIVLPSD